MCVNARLTIATFILLLASGAVWSALTTVYQISAKFVPTRRNYWNFRRSEDDGKVRPLKISAGIGHPRLLLVIVGSTNHISFLSDSRGDRLHRPIVKLVASQRGTFQVDGKPAEWHWLCDYNNHQSVDDDAIVTVGLAPFRVDVENPNYERLQFHCDKSKKLFDVSRIVENGAPNTARISLPWRATLRERWDNFKEPRPTHYGGRVFLYPKGTLPMKYLREYGFSDV